MARLILRFRKSPTPSNRQTLQAYLNKHPFAVCFSSEEDKAFFKANEFKI